MAGNGFIQPSENISVIRKNPTSNLPFIRELAEWSIESNCWQVCEAAFKAFRYMPERENLPVVIAIWKRFGTKPPDGNGIAGVRNSSESIELGGPLVPDEMLYKVVDALDEVAADTVYRRCGASLVPCPQR